MTPILIVLALLALGVSIVAFATRRRPDRPPAPGSDQDTAWDDPITPTDRTAPDPSDPFAHAPAPESLSGAATASHESEPVVMRQP